MPREIPHHGSQLKCTSPAAHLSWPDQISVYAGKDTSWWHIPSEWKYGAIIITITFIIITTFIIIIIITCSPVRSPSSKGNPSSFKFFDLVKTAAPPAWWSFSLNCIHWRRHIYKSGAHTKRILRPPLSQMKCFEEIYWFYSLCKCVKLHLKEGWQPVADVHLGSCNSSGCAVIWCAVHIVHIVHPRRCKSSSCAHAKLFYDIFAR